MKQKLIIAGIIGCIAFAGCKSRFTSTSDASGPRKHDKADPSFEHSGNIGQDTTTLNSDSVHVMSDSTMKDSTHVNGH